MQDEEDLKTEEEKQELKEAVEEKQPAAELATEEKEEEKNYTESERTAEGRVQFGSAINMNDATFEVIDVSPEGIEEIKENLEAFRSYEDAEQVFACVDDGGSMECFYGTSGEEENAHFHQMISEYLSDKTTLFVLHNHPYDNEGLPTPSDTDYQLAVQGDLWEAVGNVNGWEKYGHDGDQGEIADETIIERLKELMAVYGQTKDPLAAKETRNELNGLLTYVDQFRELQKTLGETEPGVVYRAAEKPVAQDQYVTMKEDAIQTGQLTATGSGILTYYLSQGPQHGTVTVDPNGSYVYQPDANYNGTDAFSFVAKNNLGFGSTIEDFKTNLSNPNGLEFDYEHGWVYWCETGSGSIKRARIDGTGSVTTLASVGGIPADLKLDLANGKIYWRDTAMKAIRRINIDGSGTAATVVGPSQISDIREIQLDVQGGRIYWSDYGSYNGIRSCRLDGTDVRTILSGFKAFSFTLDVPNGKIYYQKFTRWGDPMPLMRSNLNGTVSETVLSTMPSSSGMTISDGYIYWSGSYVDDNAVQRVKLSSANPANIETVVRSVMGCLADSLWLDSRNGYLYWTDTLTGKIKRVSFGTVSNPATVTMNIAPVNDAPVARADNYAVNEDANGGLVTGSANGVLANDTNPDGHALAVQLASGPSHGTLQLNSDGTFTYVPNTHFYGTDTFQYYASYEAYGTPQDLTRWSSTSANDLVVANGKMYTFDGQNGSITVANINGSGRTTLISSSALGGKAVYNLAVDQVNGKIYWIDSSNKIRWANLDGSGVANLPVTISATNISKAQLKIDTVNQKILWTSTNYIYCANLNGTGQRALGYTLSPYPIESLAIDAQNNKLYWSGHSNFQDTFPGTNLFRVNLSNLYSGTVVEEVVVKNVEAKSIEIAGGKLYYTTWENGTQSGSSVKRVDSLAATNLLDSDTVTVVSHATGVSGQRTIKGDIQAASDGTVYWLEQEAAGSSPTVIRKVSCPARTDPATVTIDIAPVNDAPVATPPAVGVVLAVGTNITLGGSDVDGDMLSYVIVAGQTSGRTGHGTWQQYDPSDSSKIRYVPDANYEGADSFTYKVWDGKAYSAVVTVNFTVDAVCPVIRITSSNEINQPGTYVLTFMVDGVAESASGDALRALRLPPGNLTEGYNDFQIVRRDVAGNETRLTFRITVDTVPPTVTVSGIVNDSVVNSRDATLTMGGDGVVAYKIIKFDTWDWSDGGLVSQPYYFRNLSEGRHSVSVIGKDAIGNWQTTPTVITWTVDTVPPTVTVSGIVNNSVVNSKDATITMGGVGVVAYKIKWNDWPDYLDGGLVSQPYHFYNLPEGRNTISVIGKDAAGNWQTTPTVINWTVDTVPPTAVISGAPPAQTTVTDATLTISGDQVTAYKFKLDSGNYSAETAAGTPITLHGLSEGQHAVSVLARDAAGNWQAAPTQVSWTILPRERVVQTLPSVGSDGGVQRVIVAEIYDAAGAKTYSARVQKQNADGSYQTLREYAIASYGAIQVVDTTWQKTSYFVATATDGRNLTFGYLEPKPSGTKNSFEDVDGRMIYRSGQITIGYAGGENFMADLSGAVPYAKITHSNGQSGSQYRDVAVYHYTQTAPAGKKLLFQYQDGPASSNWSPIYNVYGILELSAKADPLVGDENIPVTGKITVTDPDGDNITYTLLSNPAHGTVTFDAAGNYTFNPTAHWYGSDTFQVRVSDGKATLTVKIPVTINMKANPPAIVTIPNQNVNEGSTLNVNINASSQEPGASGLNVSAVMVNASGQEVVLPNWMQLVTNADGTKKLAVTPGHDASGTYKLRVKAQDTAGQAQVDFTLTINNVAVPPVMTPVTEKNTNEGTELSIGLTALSRDPNAGDLIFNAVLLDANGQEIPLPDWLNFSKLASRNPRTGEITWYLIAAPGHDASGTYRIRAKATDLAGEAQTDFTLTINNVAVPPVMTPIPDQNISEGTTLDVNISAQSQDPGAGELTVSAVMLNEQGQEVALPGWMQVSSNADGSWELVVSPGHNDAGSYSIRVKATDLAGEAQTEFALTVNDVVNTPVADPLTVTINEDSPYTGQLTGTGENLTFHLAQPPAHGTVVLNLDGTFTYTPAGDYSGDDTFTYYAETGSVEGPENFADAFTNPAHPIVNPADGFTYWVENGQALMRKKSDGTGSVEEVFRFPYGAYQEMSEITLDTGRGRIYYTDNTGYGMGILKWLDLSDNSLHVLSTQSGLKSQLTYDAANNQVLWYDAGGGRIRGISVDDPDGPVRTIIDWSYNAGVGHTYAIGGGKIYWQTVGDENVKLKCANLTGPL
ncbi:MAG: Ig-like domain-containing protein, partial [Candidatus Omnitrophica bacterium]|nr:Ig-like domain-containing protein [Candidatus Omnitrophota bacterium]